MHTLKLWRLTEFCLSLVTLNRPKALNALSSPLFKELNDALTKYDEDKDIGAIIITGSEKAFAGEEFPYQRFRVLFSHTDRPMFSEKQPVRISRRWPP